MGEKVYKLTTRSASASATARSVGAICQAILILVFQAIIITCMAFFRDEFVQQSDNFIQ